jgi:hypothetical protein
MKTRKKAVLGALSVLEFLFFDVFPLTVLLLYVDF